MTRNIESVIKTNVPETKIVHGERLHELAKSSVTADAIATSLAMRQRTRGFTDIRRLKLNLQNEGFQIVEKDAEDFFKELEAEGCGVLVRSRRYGVAARFLWKYDMKKVAAAILAGKDVPTSELPKHMQREHDGPRKRKGKAATQPAALKEEPSTAKEPMKLTFNGQTFLNISEEEYNEFIRLKRFTSRLKKLIRE